VVIDDYKNFMLKQIFQSLLSCLAAIVLTIAIVTNHPLPDRILIAEGTPANTSAGANQPASPPATPPSPAARDRSTQTQADPSDPYDPYDYDAIRESNRETYGEMKGKETD
jgi:hypothetical protein